MPWLAIAFVVSLAWPTAYSMSVGSLEMAPYRILLLLGFGAVAWRLVRGRIKLTTADYLILFFGMWTAASVMINHGLFTPFTGYSARGEAPSSVGYEAAAIAVIETVGAYFLARAVVSGPLQFAAVMKAFGWVTLGVCLFAVVEARTGNNLFGAVATAGTGELRFGLHRATGPFPHSILELERVGRDFAVVRARLRHRRRDVGVDDRRAGARHSGSRRGLGLDCADPPEVDLPAARPRARLRADRDRVGPHRVRSDHEQDELLQVERLHPPVPVGAWLGERDCASVLRHRLQRLGAA
jgi:hypothetical protein